MNESGEPIPAGTVSTIRGRWQGPALTWLTRVVFVVAIVAALAPGAAGVALATVAVTAVVATPLLRVGWLVFRWRQEEDWRFVGAGLGLLLVVAIGALLAALGVGS